MIRKIFYILKPLIPRSVQIFIRQKLVSHQREKYKNVWPILPSAESQPDNWQGWPEGKRFAFILTHDVEHQIGHDRCIQLMNIEKVLGFRSSFNFVPERYNVSPNLRNELTENGFEVGVHGLSHDGKLFSSHSVFSKRAIKINDYLRQWNAVGFRAPAMHHNLDWQHELNIEYDLSTFDTDPFEPQSDGVATIFPFRVNKNGSRDGYWEFPYTLIQDFTLFILLKESNIKLWTDKLDWIVQKGGMALLNVHPDYLCFKGKPGVQEFPVQLYIDFLQYVKQRYNGQYWNVIPRELAIKANTLFNQSGNLKEN